MKFKLFFCGVSLLISHSAAAFTPEWLQPMLIESESVWTLEQARQSGQVYDCGLEEEDREFCTDVMKYYNTNVEGRLFVIDALVQRIDITTSFTASAYSELQMNLRKDGFSLSKASIAGEEFDVLDQLKSKTVDEVNRDFVQFLSGSSITGMRTFEWRPKTEYYADKPKRSVTFSSDGKQITLSFMRN